MTVRSQNVSDVNGSNKRSTSKKPSYPSTVWVTVHLSNDDRERLEDMYSNQGALMEWLFGAIQDGLKFSCRYDDKNHTYIASLTRATATENLILTGRGSDGFAATLSCLYRHYVLLECDWTSWGADNAKTSMFD
jgi:phage-related protein